MKWICYLELHGVYGLLLREIMILRFFTKKMIFVKTKPTMKIHDRNNSSIENSNTEAEVNSPHKEKFRT